MCAKALRQREHAIAIKIKNIKLILLIDVQMWHSKFSFLEKNESFFLFSAAHCTEGASSNQMKVILGEHNDNVTGDGEQVFDVAEIIQVILKTFN